MSFTRPAPWSSSISLFAEDSSSHHYLFRFSSRTLQKGNYLAAQTVFKTFHLDYEKNNNLVKITAEQLSAQRSREVLTHLQ